MLAIIGSVVTILNGIVTFIKSLFGGSKSSDNTQDAATQAVAMSNQSNKITDNATRAAAKSANQELSNVASQVSAARQRVDSAGSLRDGSDAINGLIDGDDKNARPDR